MVSVIPPVCITKNERFLSCDTVLLGVRYAVMLDSLIFRVRIIHDNADGVVCLFVCLCGAP
jgi:hypothetical protein